MEKSELAVILIDMQEDFVDDLRLGEADRIIPNQIRVIRMCRKQKIPIFVLELSIEKHGETIPELIDEIVKNDRNLVKFIGKDIDDGFRDTELRGLLMEREVKKLFLMGINADYCVLATAESARMLGYKVITSNDVISGENHHSSDNNIDWYRANGTCIDVSRLRSLRVLQNVPVT